MRGIQHARRLNVIPNLNYTKQIHVDILIIRAPLLFSNGKIKRYLQKKQLNYSRPVENKKTNAYRVVDADILTNLWFNIWFWYTVSYFDMCVVI